MADDSIKAENVIKDDSPEQVPVYHTRESWDAAKGETEAAQQKAADAKPEDFEYQSNGYTVKAVKPAKGVRPGTDGFVYEVTSGDFTKVLMEKQDAIVYAQTHAPYAVTDGHPTMPTT